MICEGELDRFVKESDTVYMLCIDMIKAVLIQVIPQVASSSTQQLHLERTIKSIQIGS